MSCRWFVSLAAVSTLWLPAFAQSVISARAGLIQVSDGNVFLDDQRLEPRAGKFEQMKEGSVLRTEQGRAEILLTPGVFLRISDNSAIHMISNRLADTRVRFLSGSAIIDAAGPSANTLATVLFIDYQIHIGRDGRYRLNGDPPELKVDRGEARVELDGHSVDIQAGFVLPINNGLVARRLNTLPTDSLDDWNKTRDDSISQDNLQAANTPDLSGAIDNWQNDRDAYLQALGMSSYIPALPIAPYSPLAGTAMLGVTPLGLYGLGYGGIYSMYAPYSLSYLRYYGAPNRNYGVYGYRRPLVQPPVRFGTTPGVRPISPSPVYGVGRMAAPAPIRTSPSAHPAPSHGGAVHVGGGRR